ncbi:hypothetical protein IM043_gp238 [Bacillus phage SPG24]|nr:hypothetical protein IM043_gp238 [Bacillus phage SPG24]
MHLACTGKFVSALCITFMTVPVPRVIASTFSATTQSSGLTPNPTSVLA